MPELVTVTYAGSVGRVTLNRPDRHNALNRPLASALDTALSEALANDAVRVVVLAGAGRTFCSGLDLASEGEAFRRSAGDERAPYPSAVSRLLETSKPLVAAVQGGAFGAGFGLMSCCDVVVAVTDAEFAVSELRFGLPPTLIPLILSRRGVLGPARHLLLTGEVFGVPRALSLGLVHRSAPAGELDAAVAAVCADLLAASPEAFSTAKSILRQIPTLPPAEALRYVSECLEAGLDSPEGREGRAAWRERRKPRWQTP